jgi:N-carbamoylputrescine amidase
MKVTVCELPDARFDFARSWPALVEHVAAERSELVLLPAMPFAKWFAGAHSVDPDAWNRALQEHDAWESRLKDLAPAMVAGTRPIDFGSERYEQGFLWTLEHGFRGVHANAALRNCPGYWEANWYHNAVPDFIPQELNGVALGFLLDDELYWAEEAALYGTQGVQLLLAPRCTDADEKWLAVGERAADAAHAYQLSSNRVSFGRRFGGTGWIISPRGNVLGTTSKHCPFLTLDIDVLSVLTARGATMAVPGRRQLSSGHRSCD